MLAHVSTLERIFLVQTLGVFFSRLKTKPICALLIAVILQAVAAPVIANDAKAIPTAAVQLISPVAMGEPVVLDGAESLSPAGAKLAYSWRIAKVPVGSVAALDDLRKVRPRFTPDIAGDYTLELIVRSNSTGSGGDDNRGSASTPLQFIVSTTHQAPTAKIVVSRHPVTGVYSLDGRRSFDNDGDALTYAWTLAAKPRGSAAVIANPASALAQLSADAAGSYQVALAVTDARGKTTVAAPVTVTQGQAILGANAGPDRRGQAGQVQWLDPFGSTDEPQVAGQVLSASWALVASPVGSKAVLGVGLLGRTSFTPDVAGDYVAQLTVTDGTSTAYDWMVVSVGASASVPPVATAGTYPQATIGTRVDLSATTSTDLDGDLITYSWAILSKPAGSAAGLTNNVSPRPSLTPDVAGLYVVQLQTRDQTGLASYATALVSTSPLPPVADAGPDRLADANRQAIVSAAGSTGAALNYQWSLLGYARKTGSGGGDDDHRGDDGHYHDGDGGSCSDGDRYDAQGTWHSHDEGGSGSDGATGANGSSATPKATIATPALVATSVTLDSGTVPLSQAVLLAPVALPSPGTDAGVDNSGLRLTPLGVVAGAPGGPKSIWQIRNSSNRCRTVTLAAVGNSYAQAFTLPGKTELYVASPFAIGNAPHKLIENSTQRDIKAANSAAFTDARPIGTAGPTQFAVFQVMVSNAAGSSADTVLVTTGDVAPVAAISGAATGITGASVTLDGSASSDANGTALSYRWSLIYRPAGSLTVLTGATTVTPKLTPDTRGLYVAQLIVSDGALDSAPVTFVLNVPNRPPVITSTPVTTAILSTGYFYTLAATDPDNDPIAFALVTGPTGFSLSGAGLSWTPTAAGSYPVVVRASDGQGGVTDQSFTITVAPQAGNLPPVMAKIGDKSVNLGQTLAFTVSATDPNGDVVSFGASPLPTGAMLDAKTGAFTFRPTSATPATYAVSFTASDGKARSQQTITITVVPGDPAQLSSISGRVLDATDFANGIVTPLSGATVTIRSATATTTATGAFSVSGLIAGTSSLSATRTGYAQSTRPVTLYTGSLTSVDPDVLLVRVSGTGTAVDPANPTTVTAPTIPGVAVTVPAGVARNPDGTPYLGTLTLADVPPKAASLPDTIRSCSVQTLAASSPVSFSSPAALTLPNRDALLANTKVEVWALDTVKGTYFRVAIGQVSADGTSISTTIGGLSAATSFVVTPIAPESSASSIQPKNRWVPSVLGEGNLKAMAAMPGHESVGQTRAASLTYNSATADPRPVLSSIINIDVRRGLPNALETQLYVNGVKIPDILVTNLSAPANARDTGISGTAEKLSRQITFDASFLSTGAYPYRILTFATYGCSSIASVETGRVFVNNRSDSDTGRGWKHTDLQQVTFSPDGAAVVEEPDGSLTRFEAKKAVSAFDRKPFRFAPVGGNYIVTADFNGDGKPDFAFTDEGTGKIVVYLNQGDGNFTRRTDVAYLVGGNPPPPEGTTYGPIATSLATGDINGDGIPDLVITTQFVQGATPGVYTALGLGDGTFGPLTQLPNTVNTNLNYSTAQIADLDGDGNADIIVTQGALNQLIVLWGKGDGTFELGTQSFDGNVQRFIVRDLNGDGKPDLFYTSGPIAYAYVNKGNRTFTQIADVKGEYTPLTLLNQLFDVKGPNRLGQTDLVIAGNSNTLTVAYFDPTKGSLGSIGLRQSTPIPNGSGYISSVRFVDFDGTGFPGILLGLQNAGVASAMMMKGNADGTYGAPTPLPLGHGTDHNSVVDMDGDGGPDLVSLNRFDGYVELSRIVDGKYVSPLPDFTTFEKQADGSYIRRYKDGSSVVFNAKGLQTATIDPNGNTTSYTYDAAGHLLTQTDPAGLATNYTYAGGKLASVTDPAGKVTAFALNNGLLQVVTRADATTLGYAYDASGHLTGQTDALGAATTNSYNAAGQLVKTTFPDGASVKLDIAKSLGIADLSGPAPGPQNYVRPEDRVTSLTDPRGKVTVVQLNEWGGVLRQHDPLGRLTSYTRTPSDLITRIDAPSSAAPPPVAGSSGGVTAPLTIGPSVSRSVLAFLEKCLGLVIKTTVTDPLAPPTITGFVTTAISYDGFGNVIEVRKAYGSPIETRTTYEYEPLHNGVTKKTEWSYNPFSAPVSITLTSYDAFGNLTSETEVENVFGGTGSSKAYTYDLRGLQLTATDQNGHMTTMTYDSQGRMLTTTNAAGVVTRYNRDAAGNVVSQIDAEGDLSQRSIAMTYDVLNQLTSYADGEGNRITLAYDANGSRIAKRDPTGVVTSRTYDANGRLIGGTDPGAGPTVFAFDAASNLIQVTDSAGITAAFEYDDVNRLVRSVDGKGGVRLLTYDLGDNVVAQTDALGNTTTIAYDLLNRAVARTDASGNTWRFEYDARDLRTRDVRPSGRTLDYSYDARQRLRGMTNNFVVVRGYDYDPASNVVQQSDGNNFTTFSYDALNRVVSAALPSGALAFAYDALNRRVTRTDETGAQETTLYDRADRIVSITAPSGKSVARQYDGANRPVRVFWPNGQRTQMAYDAGAGTGSTGRLASVAYGLDQAGGGGSPLNQLLGTAVYGYEARGNITSLAEPSRTRNLSYDAPKRLVKVEETRPAPNLPVTTESYTLDAEGNRVASHLSAFHVTALANRLTEDVQNTYAYDADGNMVSKTVKASGQQWRYAYDIFNRLVAAEAFASAGASSYSSRVEYSYDGLDNRVLRRELASGGTVVRETRSQYENHSVVSLTDTAFAATGATAKRLWYTAGGLDEIWAVTTNAAGTPNQPATGSLYAATDHLGTLRALIDDAGQVVSQGSFDSYGNAQTNVDGVSPQPYRYTGREYDALTGLYNYRSREYDPNAGRFLQEDRILEKSNVLNYYRYVKNNPVRYRDPSGEVEAIEYACATSFAIVSGSIVGTAAIANFAKAFIPIIDAFNPGMARGVTTRIIPLLNFARRATVAYGLICGSRDFYNVGAPVFFLAIGDVLAEFINPAMFGN